MASAVNKLRVFGTYLLFATIAVFAIPNLWRINVGHDIVPHTFIIGVIIAYLWLMQLSVREIRYLGPPAIRYATGGFIFSLALSSLFTVFRGAQINVVLVVNLFFLALIPLLLSSSIREANVFKRCLTFLALNGIFLFFYGVYGFFTGRVGDPSEHLLGYFGITYLAATRNTDMFYLSSTFFILFAYWLFGPPGSNKLFRNISGIIAGMVLLGIVLSLSRGAWVSTIVAIFVVLCMGWRHVKKGLILRASAVICFTLLVVMLAVPREQIGLDLVLPRFKTLIALGDGPADSIRDRLEILRGTAILISQQPFTGVGVGNFGDAIEETDVVISHRANHAENSYLQAWSEQGIFGFVAFTALIVYALRKLYYIIKKRQYRNADAWIPLGLLGVMASWSTSFLFNNMLDHMYFWVVFGLVLAFVHMAPPQHRTPSQPVSEAARNETVS